MRRGRGGWTIPEDEARSLLRQIEERIRSSQIEVEHRDVLIRLRSMIEEDLASDSQVASCAPELQGGDPGDPELMANLDR